VYNEALLKLYMEVYMLSFTLDRNFVNQYRERPEPFGFGALGALTFYRTYSRIKDNGKYESWADACERVINGMYSIQADYCSENGIPFNRDKAMASAREAFDRLFNFKWSPPGRGLSHMGANSVHERGMYEAVQNCSFISTESIAQHRGALFSWMMEMLMLGVGVGSDVRGAGRVNVVAPSADAGVTRYIVPDSREGWAESLATLVNSYLPTGYGRMPVVEFDYSLVRPAGTLIKGFGGVASGPEPLAWMHEKVRSILDENCESAITTKTLADIINMIGVVVVAGNVRRCIHGDEIVYTESGACAIKDIKPGDMVLVSDGTYMPVVDKFNNGVSELLEIQTDVSSIRVTPDHRLAVVDSINSYTWVQAKNIKEGDRVVIVPSFGGKNSNNLNENLAWIIGYFMGDGNVYKNSVSFAMSDIRLSGKLGEKLTSVIESEFGYSAKIVRSADGYAHVRIYDELIAGWFYQFKKPKEMPDIPVWIFGATPSVRGAFLAGLADADGSNSHSTLAYSIYPEFLKKVQQVAASIGVYTKYSSVPSKMLPGRDTVYAGAHYVSIVGLSSKNYARKYISPYAARWSFVETCKTKAGPAYHASCHSGKIGSSYAPRSTRSGEKTISYDWVSNTGLAPSWIPCRVNSIVKVEPSETFDIEVPGKHEFVCNSILSHNSSEILLGHKNDKQFSDLKNPNVFPDRNSMTGGWSWASNNTILANVGMDYSPYLDNIMLNGEPGFLWLENVNNYARMNGVVDTRDMADGTNPCSEQLLYGYSPAGLGGEMCTLCEVYLPHHTDKYDFYRSIKFAYLYGKTITLLSDKMRHPGTRDLMTRNRRIGLSLTGIAQFVGANGAHEAIDWMDNGYKYVQHYDHRYSDWFGVNRSLRTTSVKPSGTVSLVAGVTPGVHYPHSIHYIRRVRLAESSHLVSKLEAAGIHIEPSVTSSSTVVASFPVFSGGNLRPVSKVSIWEQFQMAAMAQRYWSDNSVSVTISVNPKTTTRDDVLHCLDHFQHSLKSVSLLPLVDGGAYAQMPYEEIGESQYQEMSAKINYQMLSSMSDEKFDGKNKMADMYCDGDACEIKTESMSAQ